MAASSRVSGVGEDLAEVPVVRRAVLVLDHQGDVAVRVAAAGEDVERERLDLPLGLDQLDLVESQSVGQQAQVLRQPRSEVVRLVREHLLGVGPRQRGDVRIETGHVVLQLATMSPQD
jgi:hypothetical protein